MDRKYITLKNLIIDKEKCIGLKFFTDKVVQVMVDNLPDVQWSEKFRMNYILTHRLTWSLFLRPFVVLPGSIAIIFIPRLVLEERKSL